MRNVFITCLLAILAVPAVAQEKELFKWTDKDGNVYYGDSVPPEFAERPKTVLNDQGVAVNELEGKKTAEQLAEEELQREIQQKRELQKRADMTLLNTYLSVEEIVMHRDRRVELFTAQRRVTELYVNNLERRHKSLREEASKYRPYSDDPNAPMIDENLADELRETKETIRRHERNLEKYERDEQEIFERFNEDIERFKILKGITEPSMAAASDGT